MVEVRWVYRAVLGIMLVVGITSIIGIAGFAQCCSSYLPIQNIRIENNGANPRIEFEVTRWTYVYFFQYRPGVGWEAIHPIVSSQVRKYGPGCYTIHNGLLRYATCVRIVVSDQPVFVYPETAYGMGPVLASYVKFVSRTSCIRTLEFRLKPLCCQTPPPCPDCCNCYCCCCNPCLIPLWLLLLIIH
ncbi:hypothetical protein J7J74_02115 [bacterium]|nr:hypothetical protein [bacterium]